MPSAFETTLWSKIPVPTETKNLLLRFLELIDLDDSASGALLANEVFTVDGTFASPNGSFHGRQELMNCRENAWTTVASRTHAIEKVFVHNSSATDMFLVGTLVTVFRETSSTTTVEFGARAVIDNLAPERPRLKSWTAYSGTSHK